MIISSDTRCVSTLITNDVIFAIMNRLKRDSTSDVHSWISALIPNNRITELYLRDAIGKI